MCSCFKNVFACIKVTKRPIPMFVFNLRLSDSKDIFSVMNPESNNLLSRISKSIVEMYSRHFSINTASKEKLKQINIKIFYFGTSPIYQSTTPCFTFQIHHSAACLVEQQNIRLQTTGPPVWNPVYSSSGSFHLVSLSSTRSFALKTLTVNKRR